MPNATSKVKRATFEVYDTKRKKGGKVRREYSWRLKINGIVIATAGESFTRRRQAKRSIDRLIAYSQADRYRITGFESTGPAKPKKRGGKKR